MADANMKSQAKVVYNDIIAMFDQIGWKYNAFDEQLRIETGMNTAKVSGVAIAIYFDCDKEYVHFGLRLPLTFSSDKKVALAVAVCVANPGGGLGHFNLYFDKSDSCIQHSCKISYKGDSKISKDVFMRCLSDAINRIDMYYDSFKSLADGTMAIAEFLNNESVSF